VVVLVLLLLLVLFVLLVAALRFVGKQATADSAEHSSQSTASELVAGETACGTPKEGGTKATFAGLGIGVVGIVGGTVRVVGVVVTVLGRGTVRRLLTVWGGTTIGVVVARLARGWRGAVPTRRGRRGVPGCGAVRWLRAMALGRRVTAVLLLVLLIMPVALLGRVTLVLLLLRRVASVSTLLRGISTLRRGVAATLLLAVATTAVEILSRH